MLVTDVRAPSFWPGIDAAPPAEPQAGAPVHAFLYGAGTSEDERLDVSRVLNLNLALGRAPADGSWRYAVAARGSAGDADGADYACVAQALAYVRERPLEALDIHIVPAERLIAGRWRPADVLATDAIDLHRAGAAAPATPYSPDFAVNPFFDGRTIGPPDPYVLGRPFIDAEIDLINAPAPGSRMLLSYAVPRAVDLVVAAPGTTLALFDRLPLPPVAHCLAVLVAYSPERGCFLGRDGQPLAEEDLTREIAAHPEFRGQQVLLLGCSTRPQAAHAAALEGLLAAPAAMARRLQTFVIAADAPVVLLQAALPALHGEDGARRVALTTPEAGLFPSLRVGLAGEGRFAAFAPDGSLVPGPGTTAAAGAAEPLAGEATALEHLLEQQPEALLVHAGLGEGAWRNHVRALARHLDDQLRRRYGDLMANDAPLTDNQLVLPNHTDYLRTWAQLYGQGQPLAIHTAGPPGDRRIYVHQSWRDEPDDVLIAALWAELVSLRQPAGLQRHLESRAAEARSMNASLDLPALVLQGGPALIAETMTGNLHPDPALSQLARRLRPIARVVGDQVFVQALVGGTRADWDRVIDRLIYVPQTALRPLSPERSAQIAHLSHLVQQRIAAAEIDDPLRQVWMLVHDALQEAARSTRPGRDEWLAVLEPLAGRWLAGQAFEPEAKRPYQPLAVTLESAERRLSALPARHPDRALLHGTAIALRSILAAGADNRPAGAAWEAAFALQRLIHAISHKLDGARPPRSA
jgi:hypothetical protein